MVLYLDDISALTFWRFVGNPQGIMRSSRPVGDIAGCPINRETLEVELRRLPSWLPRHLMVGDERDRFDRSHVEYSIHRAPLPANSFYEVSPGICVASPELVFVQLGRRLELPLLLKLGCELCGTYAHEVDAETRGVSARYDRETPTDVASLRRYISHASGLWGVTMARTALPYLVERSASAMETEVALLLSLPRRYGGYGLPKPLMNYEIEFDRPAQEVAQRSCARADLCWPEKKLDVEYDSTQWHVDAQCVNSDKSRANALAHLGYKVVFVTYAQLREQRLFDVLARDIGRALGVRPRGDSALICARRMDLRAALRHASNSRVFPLSVK